MQINNIKKFFNNTALIKIVFLTIIFIVIFNFLTVNVAKSITPPQSNAYEVINIGSKDQVKIGNLETLGASGDGYCLNGQCIQNWDELCTKEYINCNVDGAKPKYSCTIQDDTQTITDAKFFTWVYCPVGYELISCTNKSGGQIVDYQNDACYFNDGDEAYADVEMVCSGKKETCQLIN